MTEKCSQCGSNYKVVKTDFEQYGVILKNVEALKCPKCGHEVFTAEQASSIYNKIAALAPVTRIRRKITRAANKPAVYLPEEVVRDIGLEIGDDVVVYRQGKNKIVIEASPT